MDVILYEIRSLLAKHIFDTNDKGEVWKLCNSLFQSLCGLSIENHLQVLQNAKTFEKSTRQTMESKRLTADEEYKQNLEKGFDKLNCHPK